MLSHFVPKPNLRTCSNVFSELLQGPWSQTDKKKHDSEVMPSGSFVQSPPGLKMSKKDQSDSRILAYRRGGKKGKSKQARPRVSHRLLKTHTNVGN